MTTSQTPYQRALSAEAFRAGDKSFFAAEYQNQLHQALLDAFREYEQSEGRQVDLARKSGHSAAVVSRSLAGPSNYEASTFAVLMAAMGFGVSIHRYKLSGERARQNKVPSLQEKIERMRGNKPSENIAPGKSGSFSLVATITAGSSSELITAGSSSELKMTSVTLTTTAAKDK